MGMRTDNDVTLRHDEAVRVAQFLDKYADWQAERARKSRAQPAVAVLMWQVTEEARQLSERIVRDLYTWSE